MQFGMGVYSKTQKEVKDLVDDLVKNKYLDKKEGEKLVAQAMVESKKIEAKIEKQVRASLLDMVKKLKVATQKDLAVLEKKLKTKK